MLRDRELVAASSKLPRVALRTQGPQRHMGALAIAQHAVRAANIELNIKSYFPRKESKYEERTYERRLGLPHRR